MFIALIPLRGGSKSIPKKNIKSLAGKPLCAWVLEAACKSKLFDKVIVSTDSAEIAFVVRKLELAVEVIMRPPELATDTASTESVMLDCARRIPFNILATIQATSPLLTSDDLMRAYKKFKTEKCDSLLTGVRLKKFLWEDGGKPLNYDPKHRPMRQQFSGVIAENGAFYFTKREILENDLCRIGGKIGIYEMSEESNIEIDEPSDWVKIEELLIHRSIRQ